MNVKRRRSERLIELRERNLTPEQRVIHDKYLWMEIAQWDVGVFMALCKITRADQSDTLAYRKALVRRLMTVQSLPCSFRGAAYQVCAQRYNFFGPVMLHNCSMSNHIVFHCGMFERLWHGIYKGKWKASVPYRGWLVELPKDVVDYLDFAIEFYKDNPLGDDDHKPVNRRNLAAALGS